MMYQLRPYQVEAIGSILHEWERHRSTLLVLATGLGKTTCFSEVARITKKSGGRTLVALARAHGATAMQSSRRALPSPTNHATLRPPPLAVISRTFHTRP